MNSHDRRTTNRFWPYGVHLDMEHKSLNEVLEWLTYTFGSCSFKTRRTPRWCWKPEYVDNGNFTMRQHGAWVFFRKDKDYALFLLKWDR